MFDFFFSCSLCFFNIVSLLLLEWCDKVLVHPEADVKRSVTTMFNRKQGMAAAWIVVDTSLNSALSQSRLVEISLVWWHTQILISDQELSRSLYVLHVRHRRAIEELNFPLS